MSRAEEIVAKSNSVLNESENIFAELTSKYSIKIMGTNFTGSLMYYPTKGTLTNNSSIKNLPSKVSTAMLVKLLETPNE